MCQASSVRGFGLGRLTQQFAAYSKPWQCLSFQYFLLGVWGSTELDLKALHGGLNENGLHGPIGSGTTRQRGLVEVGVALLEEMCHWGGF